MKRAQNVKAVDDSRSACEQNVHSLFTLDIQPVRVVQCRLGKSLLGLSNYPFLQIVLFGKHANWIRLRQPIR